MAYPLHVEKTMKVVYKLVLTHSSNINSGFLSASVKNSANLFLVGLLNDSGHVVKGQQGEGSVTLETVNSKIDYLSSTSSGQHDARSKCILKKKI